MRANGAAPRPITVLCECGHSVQGQPGQVVVCATCGRTVELIVIRVRFNGFAIASMVVGMVSLLAWLIPCCGWPVAIAGIVFGVIGVRSSRRNMAILGIFMCLLGLVGSSFITDWMASRGMAGRNPLIELLDLFQK